jgi:hypothetical protein
MNNARERMLHSSIYSDTVKCLIGKLLVPENLTSTELGEMTTKFFDDHQKFVNQIGILNNDTMWYAVGKSDCCCMSLTLYLDAIKNQGTWKTGLLHSIQNFRNRNSQTQLETCEKDELRRPC